MFVIRPVVVFHFLSPVYCNPKIILSESIEFLAKIMYNGLAIIDIPDKKRMRRHHL